MDVSNGIHYVSLLDGTGYGDAAVQYMDGLREREIPVKWTPLIYTPGGMVPASVVGEKRRSELSSGTARRNALLPLMETNIQPDLLFIHAMPELYDRFRIPGIPKVGYTVWETSELPAHWPPLVREVDHLMVPCSFNRPLFEVDSGPPVSVVPHIARQELASPDEDRCRALRQTLGIKNKTFVFYNISSWSPRKALLETLHAYLLAFTRADDVCLILKTDAMGQDFSRPGKHHSVSVKAFVDEVIAAYPDPPDIVLVDRYLDEPDLLALHGIGDCFFSLTYSEGWGIGAFDAATAGNGVVITGWGGQLDFLSANDAYLVDYRLDEVSPVIGWESYAPSQQWAVADIDHAISCLQQAAQNPGETKRRGENLQREVLARFTHKPVMDAFMAVIESI